MDGNQWNLEDTCGFVSKQRRACECLMSDDILITFSWGDFLMLFLFGLKCKRLEVCECDDGDCYDF